VSSYRKKIPKNTEKVMGWMESELPEDREVVEDAKCPEAGFFLQAKNFAGGEFHRG
jgi:hypothetical protein